MFPREICISRVATLLHPLYLILFSREPVLHIRILLIGEQKIISEYLTVHTLILLIHLYLRVGSLLTFGRQSRDRDHITSLNKR